MRWHPVRAVRIAFGGLGYLLRSESSARMNLLGSALVVFLGFALRISLNEWSWIILCIGLVWVAETLNTAVERLGDAVTLENHPGIGRAKDLGATAVMLAMVAGITISLIVLGPHLLAWLQR